MQFNLKYVKIDNLFKIQFRIFVPLIKLLKGWIYSMTIES
jgi:hypothetical protein